MAPSLTEQAQDPWDPPCIIEGLSFEEYLAIDAASSHALGTLLDKSPLHAKQSPDKPSAAKGLGTLVHALLLTPEEIGKTIVVKPKGANKSSNSAKTKLMQWMCEMTDTLEPFLQRPNSLYGHLSPGAELDAIIAHFEPLLEERKLTVCTQAQMDTAQRMRDSVMAKSVSKVLFDSFRPEVTMIAYDPESGVLCKGRVDNLPDGHEVTVDVKSARSASFEDFSRAAAQYGYAEQAYLYKKIYAEVSGCRNPGFLHLVIENEPPYDCAFFELDEQALEAGGKRIRRALQIWGLCEKHNIWPGIGWDWDAMDYAIQKLSLPGWYTRA